MDAGCDDARGQESSFGVWGAGLGGDGSSAGVVCHDADVKAVVWAVGLAHMFQGMLWSHANWNHDSRKVLPR